MNRGRLVLARRGPAAGKGFPGILADMSNDDRRADDFVGALVRLALQRAERELAKPAPPDGFADDFDEAPGLYTIPLPGGE